MLNTLQYSWSDFLCLFRVGRCKPLCKYVWVWPVIMAPKSRPYIPNPPSQEGVGEPLDPTKGLVTLEAYWTVRKSPIPPSLAGKFIVTNVGSNPESGSKFAGEGIWLCLSPSPFSFCRTDKSRRLVFPHRRGWDLSSLRFSFYLEVTSGIPDFCPPPWPAYWSSCQEADLLGTCGEGAPGSVALTPRPQMWTRMRIRSPHQGWAPIGGMFYG